MSETLIVPRLRRVLEERHLGLDELHRRLVVRGNAPSRATLARLAQDKPVQTIRADTVLPVMDELSVPLAELFETVPRAEWERRQTVSGQAHAAASVLLRGRVGRRVRAAQAEAETDTLIARLEKDLRAESPDLFDSRGRLRKRALIMRLSEQLGATTIEGDEIIRRINLARATRSGERAS